MSVIDKKVANVSYIGVMAIGLLFGAMSADSFGVMYLSNMHKTLMLYISVTLLVLIAAAFLFRAPSYFQTILAQWKIFIGIGLLFLLPMFAALPGIWVNGGALYVASGHEIALQLALVIWLLGTVLFLQHREDIDRLMLIIGVVTLYLIIVGVFGSDIPLLNGIEGKSTFGNKNLYANYLGVVAPLLLIYSMPVRQKKETKGWLLCGSCANAQHWFLLVVAILAIVALIQTQTRSMIMGFIGSIVLAVWFVSFRLLQSKYKISFVRWLFFSLLLLVLGGGSALTLIMGIDEELSRSSRFLDLVNWSGWSPRLLIYKAAWASFLDAPWFGWGLGSSQNMAFQYVPPDFRLYSSVNNYDHVHNEWLEVLQEGGVIGGLFYFITLFVVFYLVIRILREGENNLFDQKIALAVGVSLVSYLFHSTFSLATRMTFNEVTLYLIIGLLFALVMLRHREIGSLNVVEKIQFRRSVLYVVPMFLLVLIWSFGMLALEQSYYRKQVIVSDIDNEEFWDFILDPKQLSGKPRLQVKVIDVLFKNGQLNKSIQVLNQLEEEVLYFGDVELVRALVYQKQMNSESDVEHFKKMLLDYQKKDLYHPLVIHWLIRVAALEDNVKGVLEQVMYRLQYQLMTNNLINITDVGNIRIIVNGEVDGIYLDVKNGKASLIIGQVTLDKIIQNLKKVNDDSQSDQLLVEYSRKISVRFESGVFSQYEQKKVKGLFQNMIVDLAVWSEVPSVD